MATPNYQMEKRQRDLKKKRKQEEKRQRKLAAKKAADSGAVEPAADSTESQHPAGAAGHGDSA